MRDTAVAPTRPAEIPGAGNLRRIAELLTKASPVQLQNMEETDPAPKFKERRHVVELLPCRPTSVREPIPALPDQCVVLTNNSGVLADCAGASKIHIFDANPTTRDQLSSELDRLRPKHVRVIVDLCPQDPVNGRTPATDAILELHTAMFLAAQTCAETLADNGTFAIILLGGIGAGNVLHPLAGLFTGFAKSLELELLGATVLAVVHQSRTLAPVIGDIEEESTAERSAATAYYRGGERLVPMATPLSAEVNDLPLTRGSVVVAAGGARGIGAEMLKAIAARARCRIFVLGTSPLAGTQPYDRPGRNVSAAGRRREFLRQRTTGPAAVTVLQATAEYERLLRTEAIQQTLDELTALCGADRVTYLSCDLREQDQVNSAIRHILDSAGSVDLLLNLAGSNHAESLARKSAEHFTLVRDTKVRCYLNLKQAFGRSQPGRWFNCGSVIGFLGQLGEVDYASANDFLYSASDYAVAHGATEWTLGFGPWGEAGFASAPHRRANLEHQGIELISNEEGIQHFLAEFNQHPTVPNTVLLSTNNAAPTGPIRAQFVAGLINRSRIDRIAPQHDGGLPFYIDQITERTADTVIAVREFSSARDGYLSQHRVRGNLTLPGAFVTEIAAEAATLLTPDLQVVAFEALTLDNFIQIPGDRPMKKTVTAHLVSRTEDAATVSVRIHGDVVAPTGQVLHSDRTYASVTVSLARQAPIPDIWPHWPDDTETIRGHGLPVAGPLELTGMFRSVQDGCRSPLGSRARFELAGSADHGFLAGFLMPPVLLDAAFQVGLTSVPPEYDGLVAVPRRVGRIRLYDRRNDGALSRSAGRVTLYAEPGVVDPDTGEVVVGKVVAVTDSGRVIAALDELTGAILSRPAKESIPPPSAETDRAQRFPEVVELNARLERLREADDWNLYYVVQEQTPGGGVTAEGVEQTSFSGYNYLGWSGDPTVVAAAKTAIDLYGTSCSASRLVGERPLHLTFEAELADFLGTEEALVLAGGYLMCVSVIDTVAGQEDLVIYDAFAHVSIKQGAKLSGAAIRSFPHNDHRALESILTKFRGRYRRVLLVLEGIYGMDGDLPDLPAFIDIARRNDALIMIDEAHSIGVLGRTGRGIGEHFAVNRGDVDLWTATMSKGFGAFGGFAAGTRSLINYLRYSALGFLFCAGLPPADTAAGLAGLRGMRDHPERMHRLRDNAKLFRQLAAEAGIDTAGSYPESPIVPCMVRDEAKVVQLTHALQLRGFLANPVVYPGVLRGEERLRFFVTAKHTADQIRDVVRVLAEQMRRLGIPTTNS